MHAVKRHIERNSYNNLTGTSFKTYIGYYQPHVDELIKFLISCNIGTRPVEEDIILNGRNIGY